MRDEFFGDKRDLVKWAAIIYLSKTHNINNVLWVPYKRPSNFGYYSLTVDNIPTSFPEEVLKHFRHLHQIKGLGLNAGMNIDVFDREFKKPRESYTNAVMKRVSSYDEGLIVFLDPDTGIAPASGYDLKHVTGPELAKIYESMHKGDFLVLYQHASRVHDWVAKAKAEYCDALNVTCKDVHTISGFTIAPDVVFLAVERIG